MTLKVGYRQQTVYQATDHGPFWMMDDEDRRLSFFSLQFWRVDSAIICYFYTFSYLYMLLYQLYAFSTAFMLESKSVHMISHESVIIPYKVQYTIFSPGSWVSKPVEKRTNRKEVPHTLSNTPCDTSQPNHHTTRVSETTSLE